MADIRPRLTDSDLWGIRTAIAIALRNAMTGIESAPNYNAVTDSLLDAKRYADLFAKICRAQGVSAQGKVRQSAWYDAAETAARNRRLELTP